MKKNEFPVEKDADNSLPASLQYPPEEDIYTKSKKAQHIDPDDNSLIIDSRDEAGIMNEKAFEDDVSGSDLDIPGAELDDSDEAIGEEDEENNHYSLGGDNHENLEESKE